MGRRPSRRLSNIARVLDGRGRHRGWRAQVHYGEKDGTKQDIRYGKTRETQEQAYEDAKVLLDKRQRLVDRLDDDPDPTLQKAIDRVLAMLELKRRRPATVEWFKHQFEVLKKEWPGTTRLRAIGRREVQAWVEKLVQGPGDVAGGQPRPPLRGQRADHGQGLGLARLLAERLLALDPAPGPGAGRIPGLAHAGDLLGLGELGDRAQDLSHHVGIGRLAGGEVGPLDLDHAHAVPAKLGEDGLAHH